MKQLIVMLLACGILACSPQTHTGPRPNIIIINVDDMGWRDAGFMGTRYYETPHIDSLASQGKVFTNGYASAANCAPSRASLMTGQWTTRHGIYTVGSSERGEARHRRLVPVRNKVTLAKTFKVLPEALRPKGYATCHAGKWHLSEDPLQYGFDVNIGGGHNGHPNSYFPPYKNVNIKKGSKQHLTDLVMEKTLVFVDTVSRPFFLYYAPYAVHTPVQPVKDLLPKYKTKAPHNGQGNAAYASMVENLDRNIGLLKDKLKEKGLLENTLLIFTSDNGGLYGITQQKPLRAGKGSYYEGGIRVPFFFMWKGKISSNTSSDVPVTNLDLFPTILAAAGIENNLSLDGHSLLPVLLDSNSSMDRPLYWHFPVYLQAYNPDYNENRDSLFRTRPGAVMRQGDWKLHYYFEDQATELYNLASDPGERDNLATRNPEKAAEMLQQLKKWWEETRAPLPAEPNPAYEPL